MKKSKIYVASSWKNDMHQMIVQLLIALGHEVFDYRHPTPEHVAFTWNDINQKNPNEWTVDEYVDALNHPKCLEVIEYNNKAMHWADVCVLLLPCGRSNHVIAGWMRGQNKEVYVIQLTEEQPELMYWMFNGIIHDVETIPVVFEIK